MPLIHDVLKMNRFSIILTLFVVSLASAAQDRPNILWVTSEDNSHHWIGCYGNKDAKTPNIDRLAAGGVRYKYAYSNGAVCAVTRNTLILGRYAPSMGTHNMRSRYPIPEQFRTYPSYLREAGYYCVNRSKTDYNFATDDKSHWDECSPKAHWKNRKPGQPFFAVFNTTISHESNLFAKKIASNRKKKLIPEVPSRDPASVVLPPHLPDTPEIRHDWVTYMDTVTAMDKQIGDWINELDDENLRENTIIFYYSDHGGILPRGKRYINDTGNHVPMIVHFPKKWAHLAPGKAGSVNERPVSFVDLPPTVFSLAGVEIPDAFQGRAFLGKAAQEALPYVYLYGQRFDARMLRFVRAVTDGRYRYIRNFHPHRHRGIFSGYPHGQLGWQSFLKARNNGELTSEQEAFWSIPQPVEELYDTQADPWEVNNLVNDPEHQKRLAEMRKATLSKMSEIRDAGLVPEAMYNEISKNSTVYDYVNDKAFPYGEIQKTALLAGDASKKSVRKLRAALKHEHPVVRYWGAIGCTVRGKAAKPAAKDLQKLLNDPVPVVQIAAAEAVTRQGNRDAGLKALTRILNHASDDMVALEALNMIDALEMKGDVPEEIYRKATGTGSYPKRMLDTYPD